VECGSQFAAVRNFAALNCSNTTHASTQLQLVSTKIFGHKMADLTQTMAFKNKHRALF
jgi:hypothetical protein